MNINNILKTFALAFLFAGCSNAVNSQNGSSADNTPQVQNIDEAKFIEMSKDSNTVIIDVRTPGEVAEGYIPGATLFIDINGADFSTKIAALDTNKTYLVYCRSGARSSRAAEHMIDNGFKKVCNLNGGIMNWSGDIKKD